MSTQRCSVCGAPHATCGTPGTASTPVDAPLYERRRTPMAGKVEVRWVHYNGEWRTFQINDADPMWRDSVPYDESAEDGGRPGPDVALADVRAANEATPGKARGAANKARSSADNK